MILSINAIKRNRKLAAYKDSIWDRLDWEPIVITTNLEDLKVLHTHP